MEEPGWLSRVIVEAIHRAQVREHGGEFGLRDEGLLESALARPRQRQRYDPEADLPALAAAYGFGLVKNHPFVDGNKRVGLVAMNVFLLLNGSEISAPEPAVVDVMIRLADGRLDEEGMASWLRTAVVPHPPEE